MVVVVALVLIMVLVKKPPPPSYDDGDGLGGDNVLVHASYLTKRKGKKKTGETGGDFDDDGSYAEPGSPDYLPQPPRPDARGEADPEVVRKKKAKVVPTQKKSVRKARYSSTGTRQITR